VRRKVVKRRPPLGLGLLLLVRRISCFERDQDLIDAPLRNRLANVLTDTLGIAPSRKAKSLLANWGGDGRAGA
jgi:hypothetical protein